MIVCFSYCCCQATGCRTQSQDAPGVYVLSGAGLQFPRSQLDYQPQAAAQVFRVSSGTRHGHLRDTSGTRQGHLRRATMMVENMFLVQFDSSSITSSRGKMSRASDLEARLHVSLSHVSTSFFQNPTNCPRSVLHLILTSTRRHSDIGF